MNDPTYERCLEAAEQPDMSYVTVKGIAHLRFGHLGQVFMEPNDFYDVPISKVLLFIRSVGLTKG
jgi:hypothetical protein